MSVSSKKIGLLGKFINVLSGKPAESPVNKEPGISTDSEKDSTDLTFVKNFTASGGKFLYCEKEKDALSFLGSIAQESGLKSFFCNDPNVQAILDNAEIRNLTTNPSDADAYCCSCEFLISFNGGIMITSKQTMGKKLTELPETFITIARTSQIMENLREGLTGIRNKYQNDIPSQITTIKGPIKGAANEEAGGATCSKEIYLLLLEDQL